MASGSVVLMMSRVGRRMPCLSTGTALCSGEKKRPRVAKAIHQEETQANWITVSVTGCGKTLRIVLEEVLVSAELKYQTIQRTWDPL